MRYKRHLESRLNLLLKVFPVVLLAGARQTGKTTLVKRIAEERGFSFITLDDPTALKAAREDPTGFLHFLPKPAVIDEIQRAPELFLPIKKIVDEGLGVGQFLLTGSANPLLMPNLEDSLAGRMGVVRMFPLSQGELLGEKEIFIPWIFAPTFAMKSFSSIDFTLLSERIFKGGFPRVQSFKSNLEIDTWIEGYLQAMMDRDIKDLSHIEGLHHFPDLFRLIASRSGSLFNGADLGRALKLSTATVHRYLSLLEILFFIFFESAWFSNVAKRIVKSPKIYVCDTGILCHLLNATPEKFQTDLNLYGLIFESFVTTEIQKQISWVEEKIEQYHYREGSKEVDIVLENKNGQIVGIEVKSGATVRPHDFTGLNRLKEVSKGQFIRGIVLYTGTSMVPFGNDLWAIPITALWESASGIFSFPG